MTTFLFLVLLVLMVTSWLALRDKVKEVDSRLLWTSKQDRAALEQQISELTARIWKLEQQFGRAAKEEEKAAPQHPPLHESPETQNISQTEISALPQPRLEDEPPPLFSPVLTFTPEPVRLSWSDRLRQLIGDREWETLVAGSVMNKIGALLVVIGIALFLGYSFNRLNPAGRAAVAASISVAILVGGIVLGRRGQYQVFSRGLIGAGWAALYTTAYAMYALPAARVISNPFAGSILLVAVSGGMIAHSLRYRAQALTAVAYFSAFAAFAVTPSTSFALVSVVPLAASLLYFAWRFEWYPMALFGLFAAYVTCVSRGSSNAPLYATTSLFITYWLLFESFDILRSRRGFEGNYSTWIFPINALAFLALVYRSWETHAPQEMWRIAAVSAILFLASAIARLRVVRPNIEVAETDLFHFARRGTYEAPLTISAALAGLAILGRTTGFWTNLGLAFEAEVFYLAGVRFQSRFLRALGVSGFAASLSDMFSTAWRDSGVSSVLGVTVQNWTPSAIIHGLLFYANYVIARSMTGFAFAATGLVAIVLTSELRPHVAPLSLLLFGLILFEIGMRKKLFSFRVQSYVVAVYAASLALSTGGFAPHAAALVWGSVAASSIACLLFTARVFFVCSNELHPQEMPLVRDLSAVAGSGFAMLAFWMLLPGSSTAAVWTCLALAWLAVGSLVNYRSIRWIAAGVMGAACVRLIDVNLTAVWKSENPAHRWIIPVFAVAALYYFWHAFRNTSAHATKSVAPIFTSVAAIISLRLLYLEVDRFYLVSAWATLAIILLGFGLRKNAGAFRWQAYVIMAQSAVCAVVINFTESNGANAFARIFGVSLLIALLFVGEFLLPRNAAALGGGERHTRTLFSVIAVLLLTGLLYREVSGALLTVAWGLEAVACLGSGFPARERLLRLQGLALFALCILKLFLYDLQSLETGYRILSFIALGVILLSISWIYTRFRIHIQRYL